MSAVRQRNPERTGTRWEYEDARGRVHRGYVRQTFDRGGTDVTYQFEDEATGEISMVSGSLLKRAKVLRDNPTLMVVGNPPGRVTDAVRQGYDSAEPNPFLATSASALAFDFGQWARANGYGQPVSAGASRGHDTLRVRWEGFAGDEVWRQLYTGPRGGSWERVSGHARLRINSSRRKLGVPERHQLRVAEQTIRTAPAMRGVIGGPTLEQAKDIIRDLKGEAYLDRLLARYGDNPGTGGHVFARLRRELAKRRDVRDPQALAAYLKRTMRANPPLMVGTDVELPGYVKLTHGEVEGWVDLRGRIIAVRLVGSPHTDFTEFAPDTVRYGRFHMHYEQAEIVLAAGRWDALAEQTDVQGRRRNPPLRRGISGRLAKRVTAIEYDHADDGQPYRHDFAEDTDHGDVTATVQDEGRKVTLKALDGRPIVQDYEVD